MRSPYTIARLVAVLALVVVAIVLGVQVSSMHRAQAAIYSPTAQAVLTAALRTGLNSEAMAAAGLSANDVEDVISGVRSYVAEHPGQLEALDNAWASARQAVTSLEDRIRSGAASEQELSSLTSLRTTATQAGDARQDVLDALFAEATTSLSSAERSTIQRIHSNRRRPFPIEFLVLDPEETDWRAIREALDNEHVAQRREETPDAGHQSRLSQVRNMTAVAIASANLRVNGASVEAAYEAAVGL